jgi:hypothetical protein
MCLFVRPIARNLVREINGNHSFERRERPRIPMGVSPNIIRLNSDAWNEHNAGIPFFRCLGDVATELCYWTYSELRNRIKWSVRATTFDLYARTYDFDMHLLQSHVNSLVLFSFSSSTTWYWNICFIHVQKGKFLPVRVMKAYRRCKSISPFNLNFTLRPLYTWEGPRCPLDRRQGE